MTTSRPTPGTRLPGRARAVAAGTDVQAPRLEDDDLGDLGDLQQSVPAPHGAVAWQRG